MIYKNRSVFHNCASHVLFVSLCFVVILSVCVCVCVCVCLYFFFYIHIKQKYSSSIKTFILHKLLQSQILSETILQIQPQASKINIFGQ